jgi:uncharacterized protein
MTSEIEKIQQFILDFLKDTEASIFLFGSWAGNRQRVGSDIDIGIIPRGKFDATVLILLREILENLNTPYKVDLVDFSLVYDSFKKESLREGIWWRI